MIQQVMTAPGVIEFRDIPVPALKDDEVLVKIKRIGEKVGWNTKPYIFTYKCVSFNVWLVDTFTHPTIEYKFNLHYAKPFSVLKKKFAYGRKKDVMFGLDLVKQIQGLIENGLRD